MSKSFELNSKIMLIRELLYEFFWLESLKKSENMHNFYTTALIETHFKRTCDVVLQPVSY